MCRRVICLVSLVLVLGSVWTSPARAADPNLMGWWEFDGDGLDASGNNRSGALFGDAHYEAGHSGQALALDGNGDYFTVTGWKGLMSTSAATVTAWVNSTATGDATMVFWGRNSNSRRVDFRLGAGRLRIEHGSGNVQGNTSLNDGQWHHVALAMRAAAEASYPQVKLYLDGRDDTQNTSDPDKFNLATHASNLDVTFGYRASHGDRHFAGLLDDIRIYNRELIDIEVSDLATLGYLASAHSPTPADGVQIEDTWTTLAWTPGPLAASHKVYFSSSFDDVNAGAETAFVGRITTNSQPLGFPGYPAPEGLVPGTTYYWRIEEVNDANPLSPWKGRVWSFMVPSLKAYNPDPADGLRFVDPNTTLKWSPGFNAKVRYAYFGDKFDDVNNASGAAAQADVTYTPAGPLEWSKTYYWRVDEFDGTVTHKGTVWSFETRPFIPIADPNLSGWWTLDEGIGRTTVDWSGHGHHGTFRNNPAWVDGYQGGGATFDGLNDAVVSSFAEETWSAFTVALWARAGSVAQNQYSSLFSNHLPNTAGFQLDVDGTNPGSFRYSGVNGGNVLFGPVTTNWVHVAVICNGASTTVYCDGEVAATIAAADAVFNKFGIGINRNEDNYFEGIIDEVRIYNKELTQAELQLVMRVDPLRAWKPGPKDGATPDIEHAVPLTWAPGDKAAQHEVYFGTDAAAVADANASDTTGIYRGRQSATSYTPVEGVQWGGGPYFWRVDENNSDGTVTKGRIWSFTVGDFLVVDDIESYNDIDPPAPESHRIFDAWSDGFANATVNGAIVGNTLPPYTARANVHGGGRAMPLSYDNNLKYSEATLALKAGNDWTRQGVGELSLWFRGAAANAAERMYVVLNGTAVVHHSDPNVAQIATWTEWTIPLQQFAGMGANLTNVTSIAIGFGTRGNTAVAGGTGQMYFDDIRLYRPRVIP